MATTSISPLSDSRAAGPTTAELLARLPPLSDVKRPLLTPHNVLEGLAEGNMAALEEMISGRFFDFMLDEMLAHLPDVADRIESLGPAGLVIQARPSNTINALTIPTRDGVVIVYNIGFHGMMFSFSRAVAKTIEQGDAEEATNWLAGLADWATSLAREPRFEGSLTLDDEVSGLAHKLTSVAARFVLCHELGHAVTLDRAEVPVRAAKVAGVAVHARPDSWTKEFEADRDGLAMYLRVLEARGRSAADALVGAEVFLNAAAMLQACSSDEEDAHPPPDDRLAKVRSQFQKACGDRAQELAGPSLAVRHVLEALRGFVGVEVRRRRADTTQRLSETFRTFAARSSRVTREEMRAAAKGVSRRLLDSPGATLDFLHRQIFAPRADDEPDGGSPARLLAVNAALHFEKPLQEALDIPRLQIDLQKP